MPLLYRNVVPNVPALTAGNGKIVFNGSAPSHRRRIKFTLAFDWQPDFCSDAFWNDYIDYLSDIFDHWAGDPPTLQTLADRFNTPASGYGDCTYGDPPGGLRNGVATYYRAVVNYIYPAPAGSVANGAWQMNAQTGLYLDWDAVNAFWRWRFLIRVLGVNRYAVSTSATSLRIDGPYSFGVEFASAQLTNDIRPGAGGIAMAPTAIGTDYFHASGATLFSSYAP